MLRPNKRHRTEFLHYRSLAGLSLQELADFSWADLRRFFRVSLWDKSRLCAGCGKEMEEFEDTSLDHIIPRSKGGRTRLCNLQLMHKTCNTAKADRITTELPRNRFLKALTPVQSRKGQVTRRERGLSINGRATARG